ncbi:MAG: type II 3-dehydroquinate dehydratase [Cetobacterium somerae]|jgi:3-dehydroquinate dehydratase-2|uniref:type II 3-dehydroquinate dehydratase n=1 Tax=Cetobacterium TaxID=180162 RepID=UPI00163C5B2D|nr:MULTISPECIES: type II 3-dehydroquinate dehydratase [Cetobacterium]MBC2853827.1 type II 3-dehydroquinate dehydratase [Cetobacterium sp. 2G large]MCQ9625610.1 type II 3-dehydroquinate dehydratase [Cetobacterium somerae]WVJ00288.1 type II 3-dehydroquinate dehydratase [Cetobacterium somerae]
MKVLIINGPNLNFLGKREPKIYGDETLELINNKIKEFGMNHGMEVEFFQSNHEGYIIDKIQESYENVDYLIINPGALTHYGIGIRDAILSTNLKTIEVHLSNVYSREEFRHKSVISDICIGKITGFGSEGYKMALQYLSNLKK